MKAFQPYVEYLYNIVGRATIGGITDEISYSIQVALNGEPSARLRSAVTLNELRQSGAFFTPPYLRDLINVRLVDSIYPDSIIIDVTCGVGDLLMSVTDHLGQDSDLWSTLEKWGQQLIGYDIHPEFVAATKLRLILAGIVKGYQPKPISFSDLDLLFPRITTKDGLLSGDSIKSASHIIMNPPFTRLPSPAWCTWASGKVNSAAVFVDYCIANAQNGTKLWAILPDVLRSGSNYRKWRSQLAASAAKIEVERIGQFDKHADVDVFIMGLEVQHDSQTGIENNWGCSIQGQYRRLADKFSVHVGAVVEYRDPFEGENYAYITPRNMPPWGTIAEVNAQRRFFGATFTPPFVVVRRTSRKGDLHRAIPTVVNMHQPIAVENHLLVLVPHSGELADCHELVEILKMKETTAWLDERISCRHLTVSALAGLPWWKEQ